jgi:hypothetical protein
MTPKLWPNNKKHEQGSPMEFARFVRKPYVVRGIEITVDNIEEVAKYIGEFRMDEVDGTKYIVVDSNLVPNMDYVYPGYFMTKMGRNVRCYTKRVFNNQFVLETEELKPFLEFMEVDRNRNY